MIARVYLSGMGYVISAKDGEAAEGKVIHFSKYGCSYEEWLSGKVPTHIEELYCPQIAYNNGIGNEPCSRCRGTLGGRISDCQFYYDKATCWEEIRNK
jgi:hypothetical protein